MSRIKMSRKEIVERLFAKKFSLVPAFQIRRIVGSYDWADMLAHEPEDEEGHGELVELVAEYCDWYYKKWDRTVFPEAGKRHHGW